MSDELNTVYTFDKSKSEEVRASLSAWRGRTRGDTRVFATNGEGEIVPTKKGVSVSVEDLPRLREAVDALIAGASA